MVTPQRNAPDLPSSASRPIGPGSGAPGLGRFPVRAIRPVLVCALAGKFIAFAIWSFTSRPQLGAVFFFGPDLFVLYALFAPAAQGLCRVFTRFTTEHRAVWLTIDDGPDEHDTPQILDLLDHHCARATFFIVGERAARWPHLVTEIVRRGHEIAHHTHRHPTKTFWCASLRRLSAELDETFHVLASVGIRPRFFRAPVGIKHLFLQHALASRNLRCVGWSLRSGDCHARSPEKLAASIARRVTPGTIILLHEGPSVLSSVRVKGIALTLDALAARNFACVVPNADQLR